MIGLIFSLMFMMIRLYIMAMVWIIRLTFIVISMAVQAVSSMSSSRARRR